MELQLLSCSINSRQDYELVKSYIDIKLNTYSKEFQVVMAKVGEYYSRDPEAERVFPEVLVAQLSETIRNAKHVELFSTLIADAVTSGASDANVRAVILLAKQQEVGDKLAAALTSGQAGKQSVDEMMDELRELRSMTSLDQMENHMETFGDIDLAALVSFENDPTNLIPIYPTSLNDRLDGGAKRGHHIVVYGRPESMKTGTVINIGAGAVRKGFKVLHFINEDRPEDIVIRKTSNLSGFTKRMIYENPNAARDKAEEHGWSRYIVKNAKPGSVSDFKREIELEEPDVIIVDQLRNIQVRADNRVNQLEYAATGVRNIAKEMNVLAISVTQAGDSADNKAVLDMGDVDYSNCLAEGQLVRMYDGTIRRVETLRVGEQVMGMDSTPRTVTKVGSGKDKLYRITQKDGKSYEVNSKHILTLKKTTAFNWIAKQGEVVDVNLSYLLENPTATSHLKGLSVGVEYGRALQLLPAYFLGLWLTDGTKNKPEITTKDEVLRDWLIHFAEVSGMGYSVRQDSRDGCYYVRIKDKSVDGQNKVSYLLKQLGVWNDKHIPTLYLTGDREQRLNLLAGIVDGDGYLCKRNNNNYYEIAAPAFQDDILELCWSLGLKAVLGGSGDRIYVSGNISSIPCKLERKKGAVDSKKEVLCSKISIEDIGEGTYYGITVDGDQRYVLANFIVTHNTGIPAQADVMIGVGVTAELEADGRRMFSLPKNKISGDHSSFPVNVLPHLSRVTSLGE